MTKFNKNCFLALAFIGLSGCSFVNTYENLTPSELQQVSGYSLCEVSANKWYTPSAKIKNELVRRGIKDCSQSELFCLENMSLKPGTKLYTDCRFQRDQYILDLSKHRLNADRAKQESDLLKNNAK